MSVKAFLFIVIFVNLRSECYKTSEVLTSFLSNTKCQRTLSCEKQNRTTLQPFSQFAGYLTTPFIRS